MFRFPSVSAFTVIKGVFVSLCSFPTFSHHLLRSFTHSFVPAAKFVADLKGEPSPASHRKPRVSHYRNISTLYFANLWR